MNITVEFENYTCYWLGLIDDYFSVGYASFYQAIRTPNLSDSAPFMALHLLTDETMRKWQ